MITKINRTQLLATTRWSSTDLDNRAHANQLALAFGLTLPAENGVYTGPDCLALLLSDTWVEAGFTRGQAARFVLESNEKWWHGLERVEWPQLFPSPEPTPWAPTKLALEAGITKFPPDADIYFAIAKNPNGEFQAACGTLGEIVFELNAMIRAASAGAPTQITQVNLHRVYEVTLAAAAQAGVDLGAPFTRPVRHPGHREWYAAVEVQRALSFARQKVRKPPGPARAKDKAKRQRRERSRAVRQTDAKVNA
jgi:hypothetical protein